MMNNKPLYEATNGILDFVLMIIFSISGIIVILSLDITNLSKVAVVILIITFAYLLSQGSLYKVWVYKTGIEVLYYLRPTGLRKRNVSNNQIKEVRYYAHALRSPINLRIFYTSKSGKHFNFRFNIEESIAIELLKMYKKIGVEITDYPKGSLNNTGFNKISSKSD